MRRLLTESGFTVIETLAAVSILVVGVMLGTRPVMQAIRRLDESQAVSVDGGCTSRPPTLGSVTVLIAGAPLWVAATNTWVLAPERGSPGVIIDAPPDPEAVGALCRRHDVVPVALLVTHGHVDHVAGAGRVAADHGITAYLHPDDSWLALDPEGQLRMLFGMVPPGDYAPPETFDPLVHGQVLDLAGMRLRTLHTPGHTPGHCCFHLAEAGALFAGDQLFAGSIGRTDLPGGDYGTLMRSMADHVVTLPGETTVFPGHGPTTTIARELATNPFLEAFRR